MDAFTIVSLPIRSGARRTAGKFERESSRSNVRRRRSPSAAVATPSAAVASDVASSTNRFKLKYYISEVFSHIVEWKYNDKVQKRRSIIIITRVLKKIL